MKNLTDQQKGSLLAFVAIIFYYTRFVVHKIIKYRNMGPRIL